MSSIRLLTSTAAFAVAATIANAADMPVKAPAPLPVVQQATGYVEVYGGWASTRFRDTFCEVGADCEFFSERFRGWALGGAGRGNYWLGPNMSVQLDAQAEGTSYKDKRWPLLAELLQPQLPDRRPHQLARLATRPVGRVCRRRRCRRRVRPGTKARRRRRRGAALLEPVHPLCAGRLRHPRGGYNFDGEPHAWFVRGTGRYFFTPNTMIEGTVLYANGEIDFNRLVFPVGFPSSQGFQTWLWEAKLEHRFATTPFSALREVSWLGNKIRYACFRWPDSH